MTSKAVEKMKISKSNCVLKRRRHLTNMKMNRKMNQKMHCKWLTGSDRMRERETERGRQKENVFLSPAFDALKNT